MPQIAAPSLLPCPQAAPLSPVDRRLSSEEGKGPIVFRTLELAERMVQGLQWTLNAAQLAEFRAWWTFTLFFGGAWFAAPESWPNMEGRIVRKRRFIDAPKFTYLGAEMTRVEVTCEIRGEVVIESEPAPSGALWLDTYTGGNETLLQEHDQDIPLNGSVWEESDDEFNPQLWLNGTGRTVVQPGETVDNGDSYARTTFADEAGAVFVRFGYRVEIDFADIPQQPNGGEGTRESRIELEYHGGAYLIVRFISPQDDDPPGTLGQLQISTPGGATYVGEWPAGGAEHSLALTVFENAIEIRIDGALVDTFVPDTEGAVSLSNGLASWFQLLTLTPAEGGGFTGPSSALSRTAIYGELATQLEWLFFNRGDGTEPMNADASELLELPTPLPFVVGTVVTNNVGGQNEQGIAGSDLRIPLHSELPPTYNFWYYESVDSESPIRFGVRPIEYAEGHPWHGANREIYMAEGSPGDFAGWAGGALYLFSFDSVHQTRVTFAASSGPNPAVEIAYENA